MNLPDYPDGILLEHWVNRHDRPVFLYALCNQHAIKRVAVMHGETLESEQMVDGDGESFDSVLRHSAEQVWTGRPRESQLAGLNLDKNLPDACNAERKIGASGKNVPGVTRHPRIPGKRPQECMRVEDHLHFGRRGPL
jgi:hypothetical protein